MNYSTAKSIVQKMRKFGTLLKKSKQKKVELFKVVKEDEEMSISEVSEIKLFKDNVKELSHEEEVELEKKLIEVDTQKQQETKMKPKKKLRRSLIFPKKIFKSIRNNDEGII